MHKPEVAITEEKFMGAREMVLNMGPQHPATHGVLRVVLELDGETVIDLDCDMGYLHRGVEKICESRPYTHVEPYFDRLDYVAGVSNNLAYIGAVEKLAGLEVPPRAKYVRVILTELQRIASHLLWLGTHAMDIGAVTIFLYAFREREEILNIFENYFGARLTTNALRIGGLFYDTYPGFEEQVKDFCRIFPERVAEYETILNENRIWLGRTVGIGVLTAEEAKDLSATGPVLRGSGVKWDIRKAFPYEVYDELDWDVPIGENGDTYDRYLVRMEEMKQSRNIVMQAVERLPEGPILGKVPKTVRPPVGEVYHTIESPKGELGIYIVSDGSAFPERLRIRPPSLINLQALKKLSIGHLIADVIALIGSIDIVLGEVDR